jgi:hypothetical protein
MRIPGKNGELPIRRRCPIAQVCIGALQTGILLMVLSLC